MNILHHFAALHHSCSNEPLQHYSAFTVSTVVVLTPADCLPSPPGGASGEVLRKGSCSADKLEYQQHICISFDVAEVEFRRESATRRMRSCDHEWDSSEQLNVVDTRSIELDVVTSRTFFFSRAEMFTAKTSSSVDLLSATFNPSIQANLMVIPASSSESLRHYSLYWCHVPQSSYIRSSYVTLGGKVKQALRPFIQKI